MRRYYFLLTFLLLLLFATPVNAKRRAFLIGISNYEDSNWCKLSSVNDVALLSSKLSDEWSVVTLTNQNATYSGIINLLQNVIKTAEAKDTILIHFSGHGQQMVIDKVDDNEPDCLNEAFIPYDAYMKYSSSYQGQCHLNDDTLSLYVNKIRTVLGKKGLVFITIDACHSDSMNRCEENEQNKDMVICRGTADIFGREISEDIIRKRFLRDTEPIGRQNNAHVIYISACQAHSRNQEIKLANGMMYGSLSYAIALSIKKHKPFNSKYFIKDTLEHMKELVPYQIPSVRTSY